MYCRDLAETPSPQPAQQLDPAAQFTEVSKKGWTNKMNIPILDKVNTQRRNILNEFMNNELRNYNHQK